jgi:phage repressor protein C with HTH and peptisase S24 domain
MKFKALQENLRKEMWKRIDAKELTGLKLADQTDFKQAHISNFLNRKRQLSLDGLDRMLTVQHLSVLDLLDPAEINKRASILPPSEDDFENVLLVEGRIAAGEPLVTNEDVKEILKFKKTFLKRLRAEMASPRDEWRRFVLIKVDERDGMSMYPRLLPGSTVLIDRHYNSLTPYRKSEKNMYAVRRDGGATIKYVDQDGANLVLRPHNHDYPTNVIDIEEGKTVADFIVGRVCHVAIET